MTSRTFGQNLQLSKHLQNPEAFVRRRVPNSKATGGSSNNEDSRPQGRVVNTQIKESQLMKLMEQASAKKNWEQHKLRSNSFGKLRRTENHLLSSADVSSIGEKMMQEAIDELVDRMTSIVEQTVIDSLYASSVNHKKTFIEAVLRIA